MFSLYRKTFLETDAPVGTHQTEGKLLLLQKRDQEWPRDVEKVGRLLGGELGILRHNRDCATARHILQDRHEKLRRACRQLDRPLLVGVADPQGQGTPAAYQRREPLPRDAGQLNVLATTNEALLVIAGLMHLWRDGFVESVSPPPRPLHIAAQQILALVLQEEIPENRWHYWLEKTFAWAKRGEIEHLIGYMKCSGLLAEDQGILGVGAAGEATLGRRNFLDLMSAFTTPLLITVRHGNTELGEVAPATLTGNHDTQAIILLGGRSWRVANIDWNKRIAWVQPSNEQGKSTWPGSSKFMHYRLCRAIEAELVKQGTDISFSIRARSRYEQLCEQFAFCNGSFIPAVTYEGQRARLWTFAGSGVNGPLSHALATRGVRINSFDNFSVTLLPETVKRLSETLPDLKMSELYPATPLALQSALKFSSCLPEGEASAILAERLRDEGGLRETLARPVREIFMTN